MCASCECVPVVSVCQLCMPVVCASCEPVVRVYQFSLAILKAIRAGVGFGSGTETSECVPVVSQL